MPFKIIPYAIFGLGIGMVGNSLLKDTKIRQVYQATSSILNLIQ